MNEELIMLITDSIVLLGQQLKSAGLEPEETVAVYRELVDALIQLRTLLRTSEKDSHEEYGLKLIQSALNSYRKAFFAALEETGIPHYKVTDVQNLLREELNNYS
jgi:hypothetical protein